MVEGKAPSPSLHWVISPARALLVSERPRCQEGQALCGDVSSAGMVSTDSSLVFAKVAC